MRRDAHDRSCQRVRARANLAGYDEGELERAQRARTAPSFDQPVLALARQQWEQRDSNSRANHPQSLLSARDTLCCVRDVTSLGVYAPLATSGSRYSSRYIRISSKK